MRELGAALRGPGQSLDQAQGDRRRPAAERRPRSPDVELAADEHRPGGADLRGERGVGLGRARHVVRALLTMRAVPAAFDGAPDHAAFCDMRTGQGCRSRAHLRG